MRRFGAIGVVLVAVLAIVAGGIGYSLGMSTGTASAISAGGANVTYVVTAGGGFPFFPLLLGFLVFMVIVGLIRRAAWGGRRDWHEMQMRAAGRPGWSGPGGWGGPGVRCGEQGRGDSTGEAGSPAPNPPPSGGAAA